MTNVRRLAVLVATTSALVAAAPAAAAPTVIRFLEVEQQDLSHFVDANHNNQGDAGDVFIGTSYLYKWAGTKKGARIGTAHFICTVVGSNSGQCAGTFSFSGGAVTAAGYIVFGGTDLVPITGGTGKYVGARGTFSSRSLGGDESNNSADAITLIT